MWCLEVHCEERRCELESGVSLWPRSLRKGFEAKIENQVRKRRVCACVQYKGRSKKRLITSSV